MAAPAHYLADRAKSEAKREAKQESRDELRKALDKVATRCAGDTPVRDAFRWLIEALE